MRTSFKPTSVVVLLAASLAGVGAIGGGRALAQPLTAVFTYQGELRNGGTPAGGLHDFRFRLYDAVSDGSQLGSTLCTDNVSVPDGRFTVELDFGAQFSGQQTFLEIEVRADSGLDCGNLAGFTILGPRQALTAAPNAAFALTAASATTATTATTANNATQFNAQPASFYQNATNLTSGTLPSTRLIGAYTGPLTFSSAGNAFTGSGAGLTNLDASDLASGIVPSARLTGSYPGITGVGTLAVGTWKGTLIAPGFGGTGIDTSATPAGSLLRTTGAGTWATLPAGANGQVLAISAGAPAWSADGLALPFSSSVASGVAFSISTTSASDVASFTINNAASPAECVDAASNGSGHVVEAVMTGTGRAGYFLTSNAANATETIFATSNGSGNTVLATMTGTGNAGSFTIANAANNNAALEVTSTGSPGGNLGTLSSINTGNGRAGYFENTSTNFFTIRVNNTAASGLAGQFIGNVSVTGNLSASGAKPFRIDHPDDPANKYLLHYSAESPEVINFYSGKATLDGAGEAVVELPHYFAKINKDPRYTLTAVGAPMPMLHVAEEIDEASLSRGAGLPPGEAAPVCSFRIAGGEPGAKVSWEVKAVRNDRYVQQRGAPVEVEKKGLEKGTYQHPELYGQPPEKGMNYDAARAQREAPPEIDPQAAVKR